MAHAKGGGVAVLVSDALQFVKRSVFHLGVLSAGSRPLRFCKGRLEEIQVACRQRSGLFPVQGISRGDGETLVLRHRYEPCTFKCAEVWSAELESATKICDELLQQLE